MSIHWDSRAPAKTGLSAVTPPTARHSLQSETHLPRDRDRCSRGGQNDTTLKTEKNMGKPVVVSH